MRDQSKPLVYWSTKISRWCILPPFVINTTSIQRTVEAKHFVTRLNANLPPK